MIVALRIFTYYWLTGYIFPGFFSSSGISIWKWGYGPLAAPAQTVFFPLVLRFFTGFLLGFLQRSLPGFQCMPSLFECYFSRVIYFPPAFTYLVSTNYPVKLWKLLGGSNPDNAFQLLKTCHHICHLCSAIAALNALAASFNRSDFKSSGPGNLLP